LFDFQLHVIYDPVIDQNCIPGSGTDLSSETSLSLEEDARMLGGGVAHGLPLELLVQVIVALVIL
jgi:hypothetical protein